MMIDDLSTSFFRSNWCAGVLVCWYPPTVRDQLLDRSTGVWT